LLGPAVVVMPAPARGGAVPALRDVLMRRLLSWAGDVAPGGVLVAGPDERPADAGARAMDGVDGQLMIAWPDLARWRQEHAAGARGDLAAGCELSVGPVFDGGFYLVALAHPVAVLPTLPDDIWQSPDAMAIAFAAAHGAGFEAGMLRAERGLHSPEDVRAALADPLLDGELRRILEPHVDAGTLPKTGG
jgi:glycosyltransferase A (GT-A) superfamily protein (DUF2064 family)